TLAALSFTSALAAVAATPDPAYLDDLAKFRTRADQSLTRERGWLSIVSRDELTPGTYTIGSAPDNKIVLPKALAPAHLGTVPAKFVPVADGATVPIANVRGEISYEKVAGTLEFNVNGQKMSFDALDDDGDLFIIFRDGTSNSTTYPPGRFLVVEKPKDGNYV